MAVHHSGCCWFSREAHAQNRALARVLRRVLGYIRVGVNFAAAGEEERTGAAPALEEIERLDGTLFVRVFALSIGSGVDE